MAESRSAIKIKHDFGAIKTGFAAKRKHLFPHPLVDFEPDLASMIQLLFCQSQNLAIKAQRVVVGFF